MKKFHFQGFMDNENLVQVKSIDTNDKGNSNFELGTAICFIIVRK